MKNLALVIFCLLTLAVHPSQPVFAGKTLFRMFSGDFQKLALMIHKDIEAKKYDNNFALFKADLDRLLTEVDRNLVNCTARSEGLLGDECMIDRNEKQMVAEILDEVKTLNSKNQAINYSKYSLQMYCFAKYYRKICDTIPSWLDKEIERDRQMDETKRRLRNS